MSNIPLPVNIKSLEQLIRENPKIKSFAKFFNTKDFVPLGFVIVSQPQSHPDHTIYGLFVGNKKGVVGNLNPGTLKPQPELKQDFIALDRNSNRLVYYSGGSKSQTGEHQSIRSFCKTYGRYSDGSWGQYGCSNKLRTDQHWYKHENDPLLPREPWIRKLIGTEMTKFRKSCLPKKTSGISGS